MTLLKAVSIPSSSGHGVQAEDSDYPDTEHEIGFNPLFIGAWGARNEFGLGSLVVGSLFQSPLHRGMGCK